MGEGKARDEFPDLTRAYTTAGFLHALPGEATWGPSAALPVEEPEWAQQAWAKHSSESEEHAGQGKVRFYSFHRHIQQVAAAEASSLAHAASLPPPAHRPSSMAPRHAGGGSSRAAAGRRARGGAELEGPEAMRLWQSACRAGAARSRCPTRAGAAWRGAVE